MIAAPTSAPVERVLARLTGVKRERDAWVALCPAHDDHKPSLRIATGDDGRALVKCRAGCPFDDVLKGLRMSARELMPDAAPQSSMPRRRTQMRPSGASFATEAEAIEFHRKRLGEVVAFWPYPDSAGERIAVVLRFEPPTGKTFRSVWRNAGRWCLRAPEQDRPLYNLDELGGARRVFVAEGEKCADTFFRMGFDATTSAHGAASASKTDWSTLAGREVVVVVDADDSGELYGAEVRSLCESLSPPATVRMIRLRGLIPKSGEDVVEFVERVHAGDADAAAKEIREVADAAFAQCDTVPTAAEDDAPPEGAIMLGAVMDDPRSLEPPDTLPCGRSWFDDAMPYGAVALGRIVVLGGEPGCGKSRLLLDAAAGFARRGARVSWLLGEMTAADHWCRLLCAEAQLGAAALRNELDEHRARFDAAKLRLKPLGARLAFVPAPLDFRVVERFATWADVVVIDPLQSVRHRDSGRNRADQLEEFMLHVVALAGEHETVFLLSSAIAKGFADSARDLLAAFKGSSAMAQFAHAAYFADAVMPYRGCWMSQAVRCLKQRDGEMRDIAAFIDPSTYRVEAEVVDE